MSVMQKIVKELANTPRTPKEYAISMEDLQAITEELRLEALKDDRPLYFQTEAGLAYLVDISNPLPPLNGIMFFGVALKHKDGQP